MVRENQSAWRRNMRSITSCLMILGITCGIALASDEPDGFLGFKWGSSIEEYCKLKNPSPSEYGYSSTECRDRFTKEYEAKNERVGTRLLKSVGGVKVEYVRYYFKNNKFYQAGVEYFYHKNYMILKEALTQKYGTTKVKPIILEPKSKPVGEECNWTIKSVHIKLVYGFRENEGTLLYTYLPILIKEDVDSIEKTKEVL